MKRLGVLVAMLCFVRFGYAEIDTVPVSRVDFQDCKFIHVLLEVWRSHPLGDSEGGAWIVNRDGEYKLIEWHFTPERNKISWSGALPSNIIAQVHTHGEKLDPKPSGPDAALARRLNIDVYTLTRKGVWRVSPDGIISSQLGRSWYEKSIQRCGQPTNDK